MKPATSPKGFTLIELLVVIGILAVLATVVILAINPAQLFAQARDSRRIQDLDTLRRAFNLYITATSNVTMRTIGKCTNEVFPNYWGTVNPANNHFVASGISQHSNVGTSVDGNGWIPIDFRNLSSGAPFSALPTDPLNPDTAAQSYTYTCNQSTKTYEIDASMESTRYGAGGQDDAVSNDGGDDNTVYEVGTLLTL